MISRIIVFILVMSVSVSVLADGPKDTHLESQFEEAWSKTTYSRRMVLKFFKNNIKKRILEHCGKSGTCSEVEIAHAIREAVQPISKTTSQVEGYGILVGTMVASAALTTYLTQALPPSAKFLTQLITQISTIGIYVMGSPIWEPLSSEFRYLAFGLSAEKTGENRLRESLQLEEMWNTTQAKYSQNEQMSRNVIIEFLDVAQQNFYAAYRAMHEKDPVLGRAYAVEQIAASAIQMRKLFADIPPQHESLALAIRTSFTHHIPNPETIYSDTFSKIKLLDPESKDPLVLEYYQQLLSAWLLTKGA